MKEKIVISLIFISILFLGSFVVAAEKNSYGYSQKNSISTRQNIRSCQSETSISMWMSVRSN